MTFLVLGFQIKACVSPPQPSVSHIVEVAPSMAQAASTALPPFWNIIAPAVAASGLPVMASQWRAWRTGLAVRAVPGWTAIRLVVSRTARAAMNTAGRRRRAGGGMGTPPRWGSLQEGEGADLVSWALRPNFGAERKFQWRFLPSRGS